MDRIKISLLGNAQGFLGESLSKAMSAEKEPLHWKYAILSVVQAIELAFKEALWREHHSLIYDDVDSRKKTVSLDKARLRLEKICNTPFTGDDIKAINAAAKWRNQIVHYEYDFTPKEVKAVFARLLAFLAEFHRSRFNVPLSDVVPADLWKEAVAVSDYAAELHERAVSVLGEFNADDYIFCEYCGHDLFEIESKVCRVCECRSDLGECSACREYCFIESLIEVEAPYGEDGFLCEDCVEWYAGGWR